MPRQRADRERSAFGRRLYQARVAAGLTQQQVQKAVGISQTNLSDAEGSAESSGFTAQLAALYGVDATWLATGLGKPPGWQDFQTADGGRASPPVAHELSQFKPQHGPHIRWGDLMRPEELPPLFWTTVPDDSMAPRALAGKRVCFALDEPAKPGAGVLVQDAGGAYFFRRYVAGPGKRWTAEAINPDYAALDSERDGLKVVAVLVAQWGGWV